MEFRFAMNGKKLSKNDIDIINNLRGDRKFTSNALKLTPCVFDIGDEVNNADEFASSVSSVIEDKNTAEGLFAIYDTDNDGKLSSKELQPLRGRGGRINSFGIYNSLASNSSYEAGSGTVLSKELINSGAYKFGHGSAQNALSDKARLLPIGEQLELLKKIGIDTDKRNTKETGYYKASIGNGCTEFYKVFDDGGIIKTVHSVMDKKGNVKFEVFRIENYKEGRNLSGEVSAARKKAAKYKKAEIKPDTEYTYSASGKKLNKQALQLLKDIHNNKNLHPIQLRQNKKIPIGNEVKNEFEFTSALKGVINDENLTRGLFGILDKNGDGKLDKNELKILRIGKSNKVTAADIWRITNDTAVSAKKLITSGSYQSDRKLPPDKTAGKALSKKAKLLSRSAQMKKLEEIGIPAGLNEAGKNEQYFKKGNEYYEVLEDNGIYKVIHSTISEDNNVKFEVYNLYNYSKEEKLEN